MFAPNSDQMHVVNHCEGKPTEEKRNVLQESARIARGDVADLAKLDVSAFDAVIIPGLAEPAINEFQIFSLFVFLPSKIAILLMNPVCSYFRGLWCGEEPE